MRCPFRICTTKMLPPYGDADVSEVTHRDYEICHGDECPFYYVDENDVPKCIRCNGPEEEEIL